MKIFLVILASALSLNAQTASVWTMQTSGSHASLRGIHSVDGKIAWASGSGGTVLRTVDGGEHWTQCATPDAAKDGAKLDFRGVQAWDANTAIVMSSGPGELSRLYKTTDGCKSWDLIFKNPDKDGFWDAFTISKDGEGWLLGDPDNGKFTLFYTRDRGLTWTRMDNKGLEANAKKQGAFAASNSSFLYPGFPFFVTGGFDGAKLYSSRTYFACSDACNDDVFISERKKEIWSQYSIPLGNKTEGAGAFAINQRSKVGKDNYFTFVTVAVGGDYTKPNESSGTAAWSNDGGKTWTAAAKPPHGYRSTVQWSEALNVWFTAGTNGSDFSTDDGKTWQPLDDGNWNALSLPFLVGGDGRIARLNEAALKEKMQVAK